MNGSLPPSNGNNGGCMERYANRYAVHPQQQQSHTLHSASPLHLHPGNQPPFPSLTNGGSASVAGSAPGSTGYYHHHQQQTLYRSASHPSGSAPPLPAGHGGGPGSYMAGANGWTGVPLISTASSNRRPRKNFGAGGGSSGGSNAPGNHYHHQHHPPNQYQQQQQQQQQPHFGQTLPKSNSAEFDENANLTRLALHAHGAPLILSANRYHHGSSHRNHKSSSSTPSSSVAAGAKIVTSASRAGEPENSSNFSARPSKQHPVQQLHGSAPSAAYETVSSHHAQHHPHQQLSASSSSASSTSGGLEYGLNGPVTSGSTANPNPTSTAMSTSVSSSSSSSTEMCLPRIIKPRKRRKKDRKPNAPTANAAAPRPTLPEPASPSSSASSACSCRLCDPFGRIWAFPMLRQQQEQPCTAALADTTFHEPSVESGAPAGRKKDVGVIGSNRSAPGSSSFRGEWRSTSECAPPSRATHTTGAVLDGGVSRKGSFSDSGSDSGCDLLLSGLPGLCSTEEEDEEDDEEEQEEDDDDDEEEPEEEAEGDGEPDGHDSLLSSANQPSASGAGFAHFLVPSFGLPPSSSSPSGGALAAKAADDELLLISELTKKLHETLDLVSDSGCGGPDGAARSGSCSSSSSSSSSSNSSSCGSSSSSSSSGVGSLLGGPSSSSGVDVFVNFDAMSRNRLFGYGHGQRLFAGDESLVIEGSGSAGASEMFQKNGPARGTVQSMLGEVKDANGGAKMVDRTGASEFVQCDRRNPLSLRPISVVGSLLGGGGFSNSDPFGRDQQHHQQQQQQQQQKQSHIASYLFAPLESLQDPALSVANGGDMLNCFDTVWSGSDHSLLLPASDHLA
uniref:Uncharacterized protein n=1 Tax=Anopheles atroparvus TaxID=41427 RepID=A0A182IYS7_ANOAO